MSSKKFLKLVLIVLVLTMLVESIFLLKNKKNKINYASQISQYKLGTNNEERLQSFLDKYHVFQENGIGIPDSPTFKKITVKTLTLIFTNKVQPWGIQMNKGRQMYSYGYQFIPSSQELTIYLQVDMQNSQVDRLLDVNLTQAIMIFNNAFSGKPSSQFLKEMQMEFEDHYRNYPPLITIEKT